MTRDHVTPARTNDGRQKRAIFFAFEGGTGVGHLRRLACIAKRLQGRFSCLIVTGHRSAAHWFIPAECEYIHLPSWDSLLESKARYWGRQPFIALDECQAVQLRKDILRGVVEAYAPDVIFVDHLPLGAHEELTDVIAHTDCLKYLVTRGVLNETENLGQLILGGRAHDYLKSYYRTALVAADEKVFNFSTRYNLPADIRQKTVHTGYVIERLREDTMTTIREDRGLTSDDIWVVASAGGGQLGESLIAGCLELARTRRDVAFDIVQGPRSSLPWPHRHRTALTQENVRLHKETYLMPYLHASADLVISSGGYNSLLEALQGSARILCFPLRKDRRDEQYHHADRLRKFVDIEVSTELSDLPGHFDRAIASVRRREPHDRRGELNFNGAEAIERLVLSDLGLSAAATHTKGSA